MHACVCTMYILVSCEVSGGVLVETYSKSNKTVKNVLRWLMELVNNKAVNLLSAFSGKLTIRNTQYLSIPL